MATQAISNGIGPIVQYRAPNEGYTDIAANRYKTYSVGHPNKTPEEVSKYMNEHNAQLGELSEDDKAQIMNKDLLQIISVGINNIVIELKNKLGNNFEENNENAKTITDQLNKLKNEINELQSTNNLNIESGEHLKLFGKNLNYDITQANTTDLLNLDSNYKKVIYNQDTNFISEKTSDPIVIENRLKNCQSLEFLYLKKHDEIIKIFKFTLLLFNKYKYAIKVILFLLKHLVYKDPASYEKTIPGGPSGNGGPGGLGKDIPIPIPINLPEKIIPDIAKLVRDQSTIQDVIDKMKEVIDPKTENELSRSQAPQGEKILNSKLTVQ